MDDLIDETEKRLILELQRAAMNLMSYTSTHSLSVPIEGTDPQLYVMAGAVEHLRGYCYGDATNDRQW